MSESSQNSCVHPLTNARAEVVLAMMIEAFTFDLPQNKEIYWNFSGIIYPSVGSDDPAMQMPLRVALAK